MKSDFTIDQVKKNSVIELYTSPVSGNLVGNTLYRGLSPPTTGPNAKHNKIGLTGIRLPAKTAMSHVQTVTGILLISAKHKIYKYNFLLKQLYETGPSVVSMDKLSDLMSERSRNTRTL